MVFHPEYRQNVAKVQHHQSKPYNRDYLLHTQIVKQCKPLVQEQHAYSHHTI